MAAGTLLYTTMMHILPEVYLDNVNHDHHHHHHHEEEQKAIGGQSDLEQNSAVKGKADADKKGISSDERYSKKVQLFTLMAGLFAAELLTLV